MKKNGLSRNTSATRGVTNSQIGLPDIILGIDPGKTGGLCALNLSGSISEFIVMPHEAGLADFLEEFSAVGGEPATSCHVFLEKAQAMPKNGAVSMFNYGTGFGQILGMLVAFKLPHTLVPPATWSKVLHAGTKAAKPKQRSLEAIGRLMPGVQFREPESKSKKQHEGIVDAYLIAEYGRRQFVKGS